MAIVNHPELLAAVELTTYANQALVTLLAMLNSLQTNAFLEFILEALKINPIKVVGTAVDGRVQAASTYVLDSLHVVPKDIYTQSQNPGVYVFNHLPSYQDSVGATANMAVRLEGHLQSFRNGSSEFHRFIMNNGGLESIT